MLWGIISTLSAGLFAGAAVYINLVEHPARVECGTEVALKEFAPSYRRATVLQVSLAALGFTSAIVAWFNSGSVWWLVGGVTLGSVIPFTLVVIFPTNKRLLDPSLDKKSDVANALLARWATLHAVRSILSLVAFIIFIVSLDC
jgi:uncharacterized membrane protein